MSNLTLNHRFFELTKPVMPEFPKAVTTLVSLLSGDEFGSEKYIAQMLSDGTATNVGRIEAALDWLACLARSVDCDKRAKSENIRRLSKVALRDLTVAIMKVSEKQPILKECRERQRRLVGTMLLIEIGAIEF
jgi:hypothetical protein